MGAARKTVALMACVSALAMAGCGGDDGAPATEPRAGTALDQPGEQLFVENCGSCHTLEAARTTGSVGPVLDGTTLDAAAIARQIKLGGGSMPAGLLEGRDKELVAQFVAEQAGGTGR